MKILFLTRLYWPHVGGVEKHVEKLSEVLVKKGHEVTIITTRYGKDLRFHVSIHGINIIRFDQPKMKYLGLLYTWCWMIRHLYLLNDMDVIHVHDVFIWYWPIRLLLPFKKVFVTFHGQWGKFPISKIDVIQKKIAAFVSSGNICIGEYIPKQYGIKADIVSYGAATVLHNSVARKNNSLLVYIGRLDRDLPVRIIIKVLEKIAKAGKYAITFCGDGDLATEASKYGKVHGFVDPGQYYKKARFVFASGYLTILEAFAHKCLVLVAYDNPLQRDYYNLTPFSKFIIIAKDSDKLYKKFVYYQTHIKEGNKLIDKGFDWVKKQTWDKMTLLYMQLWRTK